jgi:hypothetical protein
MYDDVTQVDLFEDRESQDKVLAFVKENSARILGKEPPVCLVSGCRVGVFIYM